MFTLRLLAVMSLGVTLLATAGCGGNGVVRCQLFGLNVTPSTATANHAAAVPGNSQVFSASDLCGATGALISSNWTASDPSIHLSASPTTQVTATCTAALTNPVTITATAADGSMKTGQASLTCN
jgi:hypothetical protein